MIFRRVDETGSAVMLRAGSGRPRSARATKKIAEGGELICSQEDKRGTSKSSRQIARQLNISATSVRRTAKRNLKLSAFRRVSAQVLSDAIKTEMTRAFQSSAQTTDYLNPPVNSQNDRVWVKGRN